MSISINVTPNMTLGDLKNTFHAAFPQLKIEFYSKAHEKGTMLPPDEMLHKDHDTVGQFLKNNDKNISLNIEPTHTVWETEQQFEDKLHLHVQLFRRMGDTWIVTSKTDKWTLARQSERSLEMMHANPTDKYAQETDYHEQT